MKALVFKEFGKPEVLHEMELPDPKPGPTDVIVRTRAIGLNFSDIYRRRGQYAIVAGAPYILGYEAAGTVESVGTQVRQFKAGDRVCFGNVPKANAELVCAPEDKLISIPSDISFETAAAILLQGMTAHYLVMDAHLLIPGETVLIHSAAGGVGLLLLQLSKMKGAKAIGIVSKDGKVKAAKLAGAENVITSNDGIFAETVKSLTGGRGVNIVYDSVGTTLNESFRSVRTRGKVIFFGWSGGEPPPISPRLLMDESKILIGADLWNYVANRDELITRTDHLFQWIRDGHLKANVFGVFPFSRAIEAHYLLEGRQTTGKILLTSD